MVTILVLLDECFLMNVSKNCKTSIVERPFFSRYSKTVEISKRNLLVGLLLKSRIKVRVSEIKTRKCATKIETSDRPTAINNLSIE